MGNQYLLCLFQAERAGCKAIEGVGGTQGGGMTQTSGCWSPPALTAVGLLDSLPLAATDGAAHHPARHS